MLKALGIRFDTDGCSLVIPGFLSSTLKVTSLDLPHRFPIEEYCGVNPLEITHFQLGRHTWYISLYLNSLNVPRATISTKLLPPVTQFYA